MIPIAKPYLGEEEAAAARETILSGWVTQGPKVKQFEDNFAAFVSSKYACAVSSCTTALHLALLVVGVKPGDVVITVSHSFIATANAVRHCGAEPVFVDIDPDTFNMSPELLKKCLYKDCEVQDGLLFYRDVSKLAVSESPLCHLANKKSKNKNSRIGRIAAIMPVHQMGMPCDLDAILSLAHEFNLLVVEDAACATGSEIKINARWEKIGKPHGDIACFSFHPRKVLTTGDGGMITTDNADIANTAIKLRNSGRTAKYEHDIIGYTARLNTINAAIGRIQLKRLDEWNNKRRNIARQYMKELNELEDYIKLPPQGPSYITPVFHLFVIRTAQRDALHSWLKKLGIECGVHYPIPIPLQPVYRSLYGFKEGDFPVSEHYGATCLSLPMHPNLEDDDIRFICEQIKIFHEHS